MDFGPSDAVTHQYTNLIAVDDKKVGDDLMISNYGTEISAGQHSLFVFTYKSATVNKIEGAPNNCYVAELDITLKADTHYIVQSYGDIDINIALIDTSTINVNNGHEKQNHFQFNSVREIVCVNVEMHRDAFLLDISRSKII